MIFFYNHFFAFYFLIKYPFFRWSSKLSNLPLALWESITLATYPQLIIKNLYMSVIHSQNRTLTKRKRQIINFPKDNLIYGLFTNKFFWKLVRKFFLLLFAHTFFGICTNTLGVYISDVFWTFYNDSFN